MSKKQMVSKILIRSVEYFHLLYYYYCSVGLTLRNLFLLITCNFIASHRSCDRSSRNQPNRQVSFCHVCDTAAWIVQLQHHLIEFIPLISREKT